MDTIKDTGMTRTLGKVLSSLLALATVLLAGCGSSNTVAQTRGAAVMVRSGGRDSVPGVEIIPAATPPAPQPVPPPPGQTSPPTGPGGNPVQVTQYPLRRVAGDGVAGDPNTNSFYSLSANQYKVQAAGLAFQYCAEYTSPNSVDAVVQAAQRATQTWSGATGGRTTFTVAKSTNGWTPPRYDGRSTIEWAVLKCPDAEPASVVYVYTDGHTVIEADILLSAASSQTWYVNPAIQPGQWLAGLGMDVQAAVTHELGHVLGLQDVHPDASAPDKRTATMYYAAYDGQLGKQVLTPGDISGAWAATR